MFAAWAGTRGSHNVPDAHYSRDAWQEWRRRENPQQRKARRICEAVRRVASFAQCCFNQFWADRERNRRKLRLKLAVLRKARACNNWSRAHHIVSRIVWRTRTAMDKARWPKRISSLMADGRAHAAGCGAPAACPIGAIAPGTTFTGQPDTSSGCGTGSNR